MSQDDPMRKWIQKNICLLFVIFFLCLFPFFVDFFLFHEALLLLDCLIDLMYSYI